MEDVANFMGFGDKYLVMDTDVEQVGAEVFLLFGLKLDFSAGDFPRLDDVLMETVFMSLDAVAVLLNGLDTAGIFRETGFSLIWLISKLSDICLSSRSSDSSSSSISGLEDDLTSSAPFKVLYSGSIAWSLRQLAEEFVGFFEVTSFTPLKVLS